MKYLLDMHVLLWIAVDDPRLVKKARSIYLDVSNSIYVSVATIWELAIRSIAISPSYAASQVIMMKDHTRDLWCPPSDGESGGSRFQSTWSCHRHLVELRRVSKFRRTQ